MTNDGIVASTDSADEVRNAVLLALHFSKGVQSREAFELLLTQEPFYRYDLAVVRSTFAELEASGLAVANGETIQSKVAYDLVSGQLPRPDDLGPILASLSDDELTILGAVLCQTGDVEKRDVESYGFGHKRDAWRLADASRSLGGRRLVVETLSETGQVVFLVPNRLKGALHAAFKRMRDERLLPEGHKALVARLEAGGTLTDVNIRKALLAVKHEDFLPEHVRHLAYSEASVNISTSRTEWRAHDGIEDWGIQADEDDDVESGLAVERWTTSIYDQVEHLSLIELAPGQKVLLCGYDYGFFECLVAHIVGKTGQVVLVDDDADALSTCEAFARERPCAQWMRFQLGDPTVGFPGTFDRIVVAGNVPRVPRPLVSLLGPNGLMLVPLKNGDDDTILRLRMENGVPSFDFDSGWECGPLRGAHGWGDIEVLTNLESLRAGTQQVLRARFSINRCWQALTESNLLPMDVDIEQAISVILEPVNDEGGFRQFIIALQSVGAERLQNLLVVPDKATGRTIYREEFKKVGVDLPDKFEGRVSGLAGKLVAARKVRNFFAHPLDPANQGDTKGPRKNNGTDAQCHWHLGWSA